MRAAEAVSDSLWKTTDALRELIHRRRGRLLDREREVSGSMEDRLAECLDRLRRAQEAFKAAGPKSI